MLFAAFKNSNIKKMLLNLNTSIFLTNYAMTYNKNNFIFHQILFDSSFHLRCAESMNAQTYETDKVSKVLSSPCQFF